MEWPAAAGVVDDRGYCGRGPAQVSASGVDTVAFRSFGEVVSKAIFFRCPEFFCMPSSVSTLFLFMVFLW